MREGKFFSKNILIQKKENELLIKVTGRKFGVNNNFTFYASVGARLLGNSCVSGCFCGVGSSDAGLLGSSSFSGSYFSGSSVSCSSEIFIC